MASGLIPTVVDINAGGDGFISNDPLALFDSIVVPFDTNLNDITNNRIAGIAQNGAVVTATNPKFGAGSLSIPSTNFSQNIWARYPINPGSPLDILSGTGDFCIDFWVRVTSLTGGMVVCYGSSNVSNDAGAHRITLIIDSSGVRVSTGIPSWDTTSTASTIATNTWVHIAITRQASRGQLYVNGVVVGPSASWPAGYTFPVGQSYVTLGWDPAITGALAPCQIDEFRVTKGNARYTANFTPPTTATTFVPVSQGYSNGFVGGNTFGAIDPDPGLIDTDTIAEISVVNTGVAGAPIYNFVVSVEGEMLAGDLDTVSFTDYLGNPQSFDATDATFTLSDDNTFGTWSWPTTGYLLPTGAATPVTITFEDPNVEFNCDCEAVSSYSTLAQLRTRMAIQCGYAAMASNLPPGQIAEFNEYLFTSQRQLYYKFRSQRTERFFRWTMVRGQRYYALGGDANVCDLTLDPLGITWVGFEDLNQAWYRLVEGIDPVYYTRANINFGWPTRYEIRSCIEIFPAPQAAYTLWIKGDIGLAPFAADSDRTTFDDEAVLLYAVGQWRTDKGKAGAQEKLGQATQRIQDLTARKHGTARYVPSTYVQNPATPPRFLPLGNQQS